MTPNIDRLDSLPTRVIPVLPLTADRASSARNIARGPSIDVQVAGPHTVRITLVNTEYTGIYASHDDAPRTLRLVGPGSVQEAPPVSGMAARRIEMQDWIKAWADDARRRGLSPKFIRQQESRIGHLEMFRKGRDLTPDLMRDWLGHLAAVGMPRSTGGSRPCSAKTLNNHLSAARKFFKWCRAAQYLDHDPTAGIEWGRVRRGKGRVLSARQVWAIFEAAQQDEAARKPRCADHRGRVRLRAGYYRVLIATGMRAGAAENLRVRDFLLNAEPPRIVVRAEHDKSGIEREIIISDDDRVWFERHLAGRSPEQHAFDRPHYKTLYSDAKAAGVPVKDERGRGVGMHCFRRYHGTEMDRQGFTMEQIRQRLGHKTMQSTMGYLVRDVEEQQGVAERLGSLAGKNSGANADMPLDKGDGVPDNFSARNGLTQTSDRPDCQGSDPSAAVSRKTTRRGRPASGLDSPPGPIGPGRNETRPPQRGPVSEAESGRQDLNLRPFGLDESVSRVALLHRIIDLLDRETPGRKAEGHGDDAKDHWPR